MNYLLYQEDNIVGVFNDFSKAKDMATGIIDNGWAKNFKIIEYKVNSCCKGTIHKQRFFSRFRMRSNNGVHSLRENSVFVVYPSINITTPIQMLGLMGGTQSAY